jgi:hypothetical protein
MSGIDPLGPSGPKAIPTTVRSATRATSGTRALGTEGDGRVLLEGLAQMGQGVAPAVLSRQCNTELGAKLPVAGIEAHARLEIGQGFVGSAEAKAQASAIEMRGGRGLEREGSAVARERFVEIAAGPREVAEVVPTLSESGLELDGATIATLRIVGAAQRGPSVAEEVMDLGVDRRSLHRLEQGRGLGGAPSGEQGLGFVERRRHGSTLS